jgi:archaemetzincin
VTRHDLWPGSTLNFVFGQSLLGKGVALWSTARLGPLTAETRTAAAALRRNIKIAAHETAHALGLYHCQAFECCLRGCNHRGELDEQPLWFCPECAAKICWATGADPVTRYHALAGASRELGYACDAAFFELSGATLAEALSVRPPPPAHEAHP